MEAMEGYKGFSSIAIFKHWVIGDIVAWRYLIS